MIDRFSRRDLFVRGSGAAVLAAGVSAMPAHAEETLQSPQSAFRYCLNTSTIRGQKLSLLDEIELAAQAGYDGIEPWIREIEQYVESGGSLKDLRRRIEDAGLTVESAIGFATWIVDDEGQRTKGLETAKRDMDLVQQIGGKRLAAPPSGATQQTDLNLFAAAERYAALLELGAKMNVQPQLELWGFSKSLSRLGEVLFVAAECGRADACLLPDVYHIYKGGSDFSGLRLIDGGAVHVFHVNDYPADPPRANIGDADRVYPGDGIAPLSQIFRNLYQTGFRGALSLELFNRTYWDQEAATVVKTGLAKTRAAVEMAFA